MKWRWVSLWIVVGGVVLGSVGVGGGEGIGDGWGGGGEVAMDPVRQRWVGQMRQRIEQVRRVPVRVIVLDEENRPAAGARVRLRMVRHDFTWGVRSGPGMLDALACNGGGDGADARDAEGVEWDRGCPGWCGAGPVTAGEDASAAGPEGDHPLCGLFNAVALDGQTAWPVIEAERGQVRFEELDRAVASARQRGLKVRLGPAVAADVAHLPDWAVPLEGEALYEAASRHVRRMARRYGAAGVELDLRGGLPGRDVLLDRLGWAGLALLAEKAHAEAPNAHWNIRYSDCLAGDRLVAMHRHVTALNEAFVPLDGISIEARLNGRVLPEALGRAMQWLEALKVPVTFVDLEVAGPDEVAAGRNLETVLLTLFAQPSVRGIYLRCLRAGGLAESEAALVDDSGELTAAGRVFQRLVGRAWWTDITAESDELGNVQARVYAGRYAIEATLPDGTVGRVEARIGPSQRQRVVVVRPMPTAAQSPSQGRTGDERSGGDEPQ